MIQAPELVIVLVVILLIFGGSQLPKLARSLGQAQKEFRTGLNEGKDPAPPAPSPSDTTDVNNPSS